MVLEIREYDNAVAVIFGPDEDHLVSLGSWEFDDDDDESIELARELARTKAKAGMKTASEMLKIHQRMFAIFSVNRPEVTTSGAGDESIGG